MPPNEIFQMKTYDNLYPHIYEFSNLLVAFRAARRGKRCKPGVAAFEFNLEENLLALEDELRARAYQPGGYTNFYVYEPKRRLISAAPFRDRVVHHALCNVIEPIWERCFIYDSYACRVGKGTHRALERCHQFVRQHRYALQCDVAKFFPSIDHALLLGTLAVRIADADVLDLARRILRSGEGIQTAEYEMHYFPGDDLWAACRPRGLPIGNLTSQFWANVYLDPLDQFIKRELKCRAYVRYMDDFVLLADDKPRLHAWKAEIADFLAGRRLTLHPAKSAVYPVTNGVDFVGFRIFPTHRRLRRAGVRRFARHWRALQQDYAAGQIPLGRLTAAAQSWAAHARHADSYGLRRQMFRGRLARRNIVL